MKIMILPLNYIDSRPGDGVADAFKEAGCEVVVFDYFTTQMQNKNIRATRGHFVARATQERPDVIYLQVQHTNVIDSNSILSIKKQLPKTVIVNWTGDVRNYVPPTYVKIAKVADLNLISSTGQIELFKNKIGKPIYYWQIGYNPKLYFPNNTRKTNFEYDAVFIANHNAKEKYPGAPQRLELCRILRHYYKNRFALFGSNWPTSFGSLGSRDQRTLNALYHKSLCNISVNHYNNLGHYFSDRLLMCMASGRPTISLPFPGWQSYFTNMCDIVIADNLSDIPNKINMLKENVELANYIGRSGAAKVFAEHTYYNRAIELLEIIKEKCNG